MAIKFSPTRGALLVCDFHKSVHPEMCKRRPVVVISGANKRHGLVTVVPLSTTIPSPIKGWHCLIETQLPHPYGNSQHAYAKCDLVMSVSYERLHLFVDGKDSDGNRRYIYPAVLDNELHIIGECIKDFLQI